MTNNVRITSTKVGTNSATNVNATSAVTIAANPDRKKIIIRNNDGSAELKILYGGATATTNNYHDTIAVQKTLELDNYVGSISIIGNNGLRYVEFV
jgi:hypothetical protein